MILLIHNSENPNYIELVNLNSIMILLIQLTLISVRDVFMGFKFHYDSINSMYRFFLQALLSLI